MMTAAYGATNCTMTEVGESISSMMKVCGGTKSTLSKVSGNLLMSVVIDVMVYFMMMRKLLHKMKEVCGATSHMMKDELIVGEHIKWTEPGF